MIFIPGDNLQNCIQYVVSLEFSLLDIVQLFELIDQMVCKLSLLTVRSIDDSAIVMLNQIYTGIDLLIAVRFFFFFGGTFFFFFCPEFF